MDGKQYVEIFKIINPNIASYLYNDSDVFKLPLEDFNKRLNRLVNTAFVFYFMARRI
jgi:hypothetical protein